MIFHVLPIRYSAIALLLLLATGSVWATEKEAIKLGTTLLQKYCGDCHFGAAPEGKMEIDRLTPWDAKKHRPSWQKVRDYIHAGLMPPDNAPQLKPLEREALLSILDQGPLFIDCSGPAFPGRVTIRRLNRVEYNNTVRDLCGIDFQPASDFPSDDVGYGFDSIGDVLSLPPLLLEKYLNASEQIVNKAIPVKEDTNKPVAKQEGYALGSNGEIAFEYEFARAGKYVLKAWAAADQAGPEQAKIALLLDDKELREFEIPGRSRGEPAPFEITRQVEKGRHKFAVSFQNDYYRPEDPNPKLRGDRNVYIDRLEIIGPIGFDPSAMPDSYRQIVTVRPDGKMSPRDCAEQVLKRFASRAYRRPATSDEVKRLVALFETEFKESKDYELSLLVPMQAILTSPYFLFRVEGEPTGGGVYTLNEYELATRLSYFLWSTMPDADLFAIAHKGQLRQQLPAQIERMLKDGRSRALVDNFAGQWLMLRSLDRVTPNKRAFPQWSDDLRVSMRKETELFFEHIIRENRDITEFLSADYSFLNETLAKHYGIPDVKGNEFRRVPLPAERGGLLGQASLLTVTSNPARTSPVKRGKWILENLLAAPLPPAPPNVPPLEEGGKAAATASLRQRLERHRVDPACNACHKVLDPLGFALENYDGIGGWRTSDGKFKVDSAGVLPTGEKFEGVSDLRQILGSRKEDFSRCFTEKLLTYAIGRGLEPEDVCTVKAISAYATGHGNRFADYVQAIVMSEPFQKRAAKRMGEE